jgi:hypothetical protein
MNLSCSFHLQILPKALFANLKNQMLLCKRAMNLKLLIFFLAEVPSFVKNLENQTVKDYDDAEFRVRVNGVPKPLIKW